MLAAVLAGAASGGRTFTGLAALALTAPPQAQDEPDRTLARPGTLLAIALAAAGELAADKLPQAPSRLAFPGAAGRVATAALCGVIAARRTAPAAVASPVPDPLAPPPRTAPRAGPELPGAPAASVGAAAGFAAVAVAAAAVWATGGVRWRRWAAARVGRDWVGALAEDAAVVTLAAIGARRLGG